MFLFGDGIRQPSFFNLPQTPNKNKKMEELKELTIGQKAVVDAYLETYEPTDTYDTDTIIYNLGSMCGFDANMLADYLATIGYRAHFLENDAIHGWILKRK